MVRCTPTVSLTSPAHLGRSLICLLSLPPSPPSSPTLSVPHALLVHMPRHPTSSLTPRHHPAIAPPCLIPSPRTALPPLPCPPSSPNLPCCPNPPHHITLLQPASLPRLTSLHRPAPPLSALLHHSAPQCCIAPLVALLQLVVSSRLIASPCLSAPHLIVPPLAAPPLCNVSFFDIMLQRSPSVCCSHLPTDLRCPNPTPPH